MAEMERKLHHLAEYSWVRTADALEGLVVDRLPYDDRPGPAVSYAAASFTALEIRSGRRTPLSSTGPISSNRTPSGAQACTTLSPTRTSPGPAIDAIRAAMMTASP